MASYRPLIVNAAANQIQELGTSDTIIGNGTVPTGAVFHFAASSAPTGYLKANGDTVTNGSGTVQGITADFSALYAILGSTYGAPGKLPDLRGEFIRSWVDNKVGIDTQTTFGRFQSWAIQNITGTIDSISETFAGNTPNETGAFYKVASTPNRSGTPNAPDSSNAGTLGFDASLSVQTSTETRPRNIALLACIKY
jgi:microcystin-dependent protein